MVDFTWSMTIEWCHRLVQCPLVYEIQSKHSIDIWWKTRILYVIMCCTVLPPSDEIILPPFYTIDIWWKTRVLYVIICCTVVTPSGGDNFPPFYSPYTLSKRFSSWTWFVNVQAWVLHVLRTKNTLSIAFRRNRRLWNPIIRNMQQTLFPEDYRAMNLKKELPKHCQLPKLNPILEDNLIRSNSNLVHAEFLSHDMWYPVILPGNECVTKLIIKHYHEMGKHICGTNQTLSALSARFWIICGLKAVREWDKECDECIHCILVSCL